MVYQIFGLQIELMYYSLTSNPAEHIFLSFIMYDNFGYQEIDLEALNILNMCYDRAKEVCICLCLCRVLML